MAGIYFRMEQDACSLTGYFRLGGHVDVLGLITASLELYLELRYEFETGKCVGTAKLTIEIEVFIFSGSVTITCEKKFAGSNGDPTFRDLMGVDPSLTLAQELASDRRRHRICLARLLRSVRRDRRQQWPQQTHCLDRAAARPCRRGAARGTPACVDRGVARLTPQTAGEQTLTRSPSGVNWPKTLGTVKFGLAMGRTRSLSSDLEGRCRTLGSIAPTSTPVAGFVFKDMTQVNLRSFPVRNVLGLLREHYGALAVQSGSTHPTLLPWRNAHPTLKGMLGELGTRTQTINLGHRRSTFPLPGFDRFFDEKNRDGIEDRLGDLVFGPRSRFRARAVSPGVGRQGEPLAGSEVPVRALPPDWVAPAGAGAAAPVMSQFKSAGEYTLYQANRFYRREPLTAARVDALKAQNQLRRPQLVNIPPSPAIPGLGLPPHRRLVCRLPAVTAPARPGDRLRAAKGLSDRPGGLRVVTRAGLDGAGGVVGRSRMRPKRIPVRVPRGGPTRRASRHVRAPPITNAACYG